MFWEDDVNTGFIFFGAIKYKISRTLVFDRLCVHWLTYYVRYKIETRAVDFDGDVCDVLVVI